MANIAIIPARGGSKRLPGKNIRVLMDKPLIAWTIIAALESRCFDYVMVSTDDKDIAFHSKEFGAEVPFLRPEYLAGDLATSDEVIEHSVTWLENNTELAIDTVTLLQPTSPLRDSNHIIECCSQYTELRADAVVSVGECDVKLELCNTLPDDLSLSNFLKSDVGRTQEMKQVYELNGAIYIFKRAFVGNMASIYSKGSRSFAYVMSTKESVDIDTELDFKWAEFLLAQNE